MLALFLTGKGPLISPPTAGGCHTTSACYRAEKAGFLKGAGRVDVKKPATIEASKLFRERFAC